MRSSVQILVIPGIGEDERMAYPQMELPYTILRPRYIAPERDEPFELYCRRFAESLHSLIDRSEPLFLMGCSFGGAVVQELSKHLRGDGLILVSTYRTSGELNVGYRWLGRMISQYLPVWSYRFGNLLARFVIRRLIAAPEHDVELCANMYQRFPKPWFREHCRMATDWKGTRLTVPQLRIHGSRDPVIPYRQQKDINVVIEEDMHMCNLSQKELVNQEIQLFVQTLLRHRAD